MSQPDTAAPTRRRGPRAFARHGRLPARSTPRSVLAFIAAALAVVLVGVGSVAAIGVWQFTSSIETFDIGGDGEAVAAPPSIGAYPGGFNILIVGADNDPDQQSEAFGERDATLNDVNMLLHVSADHSRATAVSIPRDLIVPVPSCDDPEGGGPKSPMSAQPMNSVLAHGGMPCVVKTVEELSGLEIQFAGLITFNGVIQLSSAIGGVPICTTGPIVDPHTGINLPEAGTYTLAGAEALAFLRTRHGIGDESDLGRINAQQMFLSSLVRTLKSGETLGNPQKVLGLAIAARDTMKLSQSLANIDTMLSMAAALKDIPLETVAFVQYPNQYGSGDEAGRVFPVRDTAEQLFSALQEDRPFALGDQSERVGVVEDPNAAPPAPSTPVETPAAPDPSASAPAETPAGPEVIEGLEGQTAATPTCAVAAD
ncbi:LCP family protein required for cell wall assembly [Diaminobutyricimonas aerilata]|uniref:LCP family protein required for cell wall assembly n=1 Tax=Diaminobutyricimonas aerilata TaxID=1162967 RepID=A0A2M9CFV2_9MICO|nr:LCP family protein [Diaminobutyricimonas aerilata]PJJ70793.1 LCP family protein required for cell wall assembly [Diaminobutyricimonas aerilata]